jgi:hypothetical protein
MAWGDMDVIVSFGGNDEIIGQDDEIISQEPKKKGWTPLEDIKGTGMAIADVVGGIGKYAVNVPAAAMAKIVRPSGNFKEYLDAAAQELESKVPSFGSSLAGSNTAYNTIMKPFEAWDKYVVQPGATKAGELTGSKDVQGAAEVLLNLAPIPGLALAGKGLAKGAAAVDPGLRNVEYRKPASIPDSARIGENDPVVAKAGEDLGPLTNEARQYELFDQPEMGRVANPYEAKLGDWRVDENGIPIKADLSMELQNLQNPLQMNLWGDELPQTRNPIGQSADLMDAQRQLFDEGMQEGIPLTQAIDSMDWAHRREAINRELKGAVEPSGALEGAIAEANSPFRGPGSKQAGAIDLDLLTLGLVRLFHGGKEFKIWDPSTVGKGEGMAALGPGLYAGDNVELARIYQKYGNDIKMDPVTGDFITVPGVVNEMAVNPKNIIDIRTDKSPETKAKILQAQKNLDDIGAKGTARGIVSALQQHWDPNAARKALIDAGIDGLSVQLGGKLGKEIVLFNPEAIAQVSRVDTPVEKMDVSKYLSKGMSRSQRGVVDFSSLPETFKKIAGLTRESPEVVRAQKTAIANAITGIEGYRPIKTPEQVVAMAPQAKDLGPLQKFNADTWRPGIRVNAINTNNPLIRFASTVIHDAWTKAENYAREYITDNKTGIGPLWNKLNNQEKIEIHELLKAGDRATKKFTPEELTESGFTEKQIRFMRRYYEMDDKKYEVWNDFRMQTGQDPIPYRPGHFAGVFKGDYKALALDKDGKVIGYIGTDTRLGFSNAVKEIEKKFPGATFTPVKRAKLGGYGQRGDMFSGLKDLLAVLAKNDPRFAEVMQAVEQAVVQKADATFGANVHALDKKGIWGNEGNKPWRDDPVANANEAIKAFLGYWEEGMISHHMMPVEGQISSLMQNPALDGMPRAKDYVNEYIKGMTGRHVGDLGSALNTLIDAPFKLTGMGPSIPRAIVNQTTKRMGQLTQGFMNLPYTAMQFTQIAQTGMPIFLKAAEGVGKSPASVAQSVAAGTSTSMKLWISRLTGDDKYLNPLEKRAAEYAEGKGLLQFSEFEEVSHVTQGPVAKRADQIIDFNRTLGEKATRPHAFFTFVDILKDSNLPEAELFDTAYNLTQDAMVDYSARERAPMFKNLGVTGQLAGNLQQFALTYMDQIGRWHKAAAKGDPKPLIAGMTALFAFAGIVGMPFYGTADMIVEELTDKYYGEKQNIQTLVMRNGPEWAKTDWAQYGLVSDLTDLNISSRLGMADVLPESPLDAVSPYASTIGRMGESMIDLAKNQDPQAAKNALRQFAPSSLRGVVENKLLTTPDGVTINKEGQLDYPRTEFDREARKWAMTSLEEAKAKEKLYSKSQSLKADQERLTKVQDKVNRRFANKGAEFVGTEEWNELVNEYVQRGGEPQTLVQSLINNEEQRKLTAKQRAEGVQLNTVKALRRWIKLNED